MALFETCRLLVILLCLSNCNGATPPSVNAACPVLDVCTCTAAPSGLRAQCSLVADVDKLRLDIFKLKGTAVRKLTLAALHVTRLPGRMFENVTLVSLRVLRSGLTSIDDDAFIGIDTLELLDLSRNRLTTIPRALRAIRELSLLYLTGNQIQVVGDELAHFSSSLRRVSINRNRVKTLHGDAFENFRLLQKVGLANNVIRDLPEALFRSAPALVLLDLRANLIEDVGRAFLGLQSLMALYLTDNRLRNIRPLASAKLWSLQELYLDGNPIDAVRVFGPSEAAIESLSLRNCGLSDVDTIALGCLPRLKYLSLAKNNVSYVDGRTFPKTDGNFRAFRLGELGHNCSTVRAGDRSAGLQVLDLSFNSIGDINNAFVGLQLLEKLRLTGNNIQSVPDDSFSTNKDLQDLYLDKNQISWLGKNCFRGLASLRTLSLAYNRLTSLNGSPAHIPTLRTLHVQGNRLRRLERGDFTGNAGLAFIHAFRNNIGDVRGAFRDVEDLQVLLLQDNSLESLHRASFPAPPMKLKRLLIDGNPVKCDCQLSWISELAIEVTHLGNPTCHSPPWMKGLPVFNSTTAAMMKNWPEDCDDSCTCTCQEDDSYGKRTRVNCSHADLVHLPEKLPEDTSVLDLGGNRLRTLDRSLADGTPQLRTLILSDNLLSELDPAKVPNALRELSLQNNSFTEFPTSIVAKFNLSGLWLSGNPWACSCDDYAFRQWAEANEDSIRDADSVLCSEGTNPRVSWKPFMKLEQKDFCPPTTDKVMIFSVLVLVFLSASLSGATIYFKWQREIKVWLYAHGLRCVKEYDVDEDKVFDVFLSFSGQDGDWAYANLVPGLEEAGFSLCIYDRNFKGGFLLQDIIQEAVACSRRTLLLLTQNFAGSEWCRWEFHVAHQYALKDKTNRLIIVAVDGVPDGLDQDLLVYMRATSYLRWGEKHFWDKLVYSLPRRDLQAKKLPQAVICKARNS